MRKHVFSATAILLLLGASMVAAQQQAAPQAPAAPPVGNVNPALNPEGIPLGINNGLGRGAPIFTQNCAGCHGTGLDAARAPSLFVQSFLEQHTDAEIRHVIEEGSPAAGMPSWKDKISSDDISQLIAYLRVQGGRLRANPPFVADPNGQVIKTAKQTFKIETVATGLDTPWGEVFLPDGRLLVTEHIGRIRIIDKNGKLLPEAVKGTPKPWVRQDSGYLDIAIHPNYRRNGWIYLSYSEMRPDYTDPVPGPIAVPGEVRLAMPPAMIRLVRGRINKNNEWVDQQDIFRAPLSLYTTSIIHYGSRFVFDGKGHVFFSIGDRGDMTNAQKLDNPIGKVHRVNDDGSIPKDNPFVSTPGAVPSIWSYGHRNPEGLALDPVSGLLWESEHGPAGGDEINVIEKGHNYGWGVISMGIQPGITKQHAEGMEDPIAYYVPSIAPSGMNFYKGKAFANWKNNLFQSALVGQKLLRFEIEGRKIVSQETVYEKFGRTRQVITGPDGYLYVLLQNPTGRNTGVSVTSLAPGMVIRLVPQKD